MQAFEDSKNMSDLVPSVPKSTAFFCNVPSVMKASIMSLMPFVKGFLLVRYLGVPFISSRLIYRDFNVLVEKLESWVND
nr:reverse transcriptase domain, reverse transcriptase zinc-binding domain protein [Tanacetum cinerariifolium]